MKCSCDNCKYHKVYYSHDYWSPDEHECEIDSKHFEEVNEKIYYSDEEIEERMEQAWTDGKTWDCDDEPICPYYEEYIDYEY